MSYLAQYYDHGLEVGDQNVEELTAEEISRLTHVLALALTAGSIPKRLNGALPEEHARDKKLCKRIAHAAAQSLRSWGYDPELVPSTDDDVRREAAQIEWGSWLERQYARLEQRQRYIATWQFKRDGDPYFAKGAVTKLDNELRWLKHAAR